MSEKREVQITGGTWALCTFLFWIAMSLTGLTGVLRRIAAALEAMP